MCSIAANHAADSQLADLRSARDDKRIEKKLRNFAADSSVEKSGYLDAPDHHLKRMPADLSHIRRIRSGRHRVFYVGHHSRCSYLVFFIKEFKQSGKNDEDDYLFHRLLASTLAEDTDIKRIIRKSDQEEAEAKAKANN